MGDSVSLLTFTTASAVSAATVEEVSTIHPSPMNAKRQPWLMTRMKIGRFLHAIAQPCQRLWAKVYLDGWLFEVTCLLLSLALLIGIIFLLKDWNHESPESWHWSITFNTVLVLLAVGFRAFLILPITSSLCQVRWMYYTKRHSLVDFQILDSATRGLIGSMEAMFRIRDPLATLASMTLIATLGLEAFTQQAISIRPPSDYIPVLLDLPRSVGGSNKTEDYTAKLFLDQALITAASTALSEIQGSGFYLDDVTSAFTRVPDGSGYSFTCAKASCVSPTYPTLALCATCVDKSTKLKYGCTPNSEPCTYTLPSGLSLNINTQRLVMRSVANGTNRSTLNMLTEFEIISNNPYDLYSTNGTLKNTTQSFAAAYRCEIFLCAAIQTLKRDIWGSGVNEILILQTDNITRGSNDSILQFHFPPGTSTPESYFKGGEASQLFAVGLPGDPNLAPLEHRSLEAHLMVDMDSLALIREFFASMWTGALPLQSLSQQLGYFQTAAGASFWMALDAEAFSVSYELPTNQAYLSDNFAVYFAYIVNSMSRKLRLVYGQPAYFGPVRADLSYYQVQWAWLTLHITLFTTTAILLTITIRSSCASQLPAWKGSAMAILAHGINPEAHPDLATMREVSKMHEVAEKVWVRLASTPTGSRLISAGGM